ncbi:MAG TPA: GIY-YIG nuclease family protein [Myxococcota bacterium]|nr:GIY-YIG nuclease family protein [Myxococcota bacterium]HRY96400.1 GIY-YIG nuclease family protein [Myxococcota bacterium]
MRELPVLALDLQATCARAGGGWPMELAWLACTAARPAEPAALRSHLLLPPEGESLPAPVARLTGLTDEALQRGTRAERVWAWLAEALAERPAWLVVHYARFERPFLEAALPLPGPIPILDTHAIARRLLPDLPSRSLRALAGFLDLGTAELRRAEHHALATAAIWRALVARLSVRRGVETLEELQAFVAQPAPRPAGRRETPLARGLRLGLPRGPGVYRLLGRDGRVLYVGKAKSLRARVNQHFRALRGRGARGLELLSQVWDVEFTPTLDEAAALGLEAEEIRRLDPPYNVAGRARG